VLFAAGPAGSADPIEIFTTRPDTLYGASFLALSPHHPFAQRLANPTLRSAAFIAECDRMGTSEAIIEAARSAATKPQSKRSIRSTLPAACPVYVANFVLMEYGTGAIFGCPAHDQRDLDFARKYGIARDPGDLAARRRPCQFRGWRHRLCR